jgi:hypothetical protein
MNLDGRMDRARAEVIRSVNGLPSSFTFNVVTYSDTIYTCFNGRVEASNSNKTRTAVWLANFNPHGWTATGPAVASALSDKDNKNVVLLTDGMPNYGIPFAFHPNATPAFHIAKQIELHRKCISDANTQSATIDVFGIAATGPFRAFCQAVAMDSGGSYTDVP